MELGTNINIDGHFHLSQDAERALGDGLPEAKLPRISLDQEVASAVKHVLDSLGFDGSRATDKSGAVVAIEMEPTEVQWLKVSWQCAVAYITYC